MEKKLKCCPECQRAFPDQKRYLLKSASRKRMQPQEVFFYTVLFFIVIFFIGHYFWT